MIVNYSSKPVMKAEKSIFLAGPVLKNGNEISQWRIDAIEILQKLKFDGIVYIPEYLDETKIDKDKHFEWEWEALHNCSIAVFWVPRKLPESMGLVTNVEFGYYLAQKNIIYGRPDNADKNAYLDRLYKKHTNKQPFNDLKKMLKTALKEI